MLETAVSSAYIMWHYRSCHHTILLFESTELIHQSGNSLVDLSSELYGINNPLVYGIIIQIQFTKTTMHIQQMH